MSTANPPITINGLHLHKGFLSRRAQESLRDAIRDVARAAPFSRYMTPGGTPMSVRMTSAGAFGWVSDRAGYRYAQTHPAGQTWPPIPVEVLEVWAAVAECARVPETCLINYYDQQARMGLHQDRDEADFAHPVVSISLGDSAMFRIGGPQRSDPTRTVLLESGDVMVMGGAARLSFHGIDRIRFGSSTLLDRHGRINLTLRVVT